MHLKGALHVHTTCSDGTLTVPEAVKVYEGLGFDFVALTDHDHLLRPHCYDGVELIDTEVIVFLGVELTVFEAGYVHVNKIQGDDEVLHIFNHPADMDLSVPAAIDKIDAVAQKLPLDAIEVTSKGFLTPEYDIPEIPLPKIASDDSHTKAGCGRAWIELDCAPDKDAILRAVKRGDFWNCFA